MADNATMLAAAAELEATISVVSGSSGMTEAQLKPLVDLAHKWKADAGQPNPLMQSAPAPAPAALSPDEQIAADKAKADKATAASKK